ncbi:putative efflux protein, MATE family [Lishizhenia tianjinensis]|uniref:Multidrug-efflux transporter n=1 Tax=Lishizhenia tianjinensis TaxID=477690 RepID=A0A1I6Y523_9FLAO|nr:MATE family efflux transporter [Lishizhenia tianjinensis]SFT45586.1 putative efflux protein, MATE family [Lishizhenia tianjinensis]
MSKEPQYKAIYKLAIPALFGGIVEPFLSLTDLAIIGNMPDQENYGALEAIAAVGVAGSLVSALLWIFAQTKSAISAIVSRQFGAERLRTVATLIPQMVLLNFLLGVFAFVSTYFISNWIFLEVYNTDPIVGEVATSYYGIRAFGFPITLITFSLFGVFRGLQNTYWAMTTSIVGGVLNVALDFFFVFGLEMGIEGAAIASLIAQGVMLLMSLYFLLKSQLKLYFSWTINHYFKELLLIALNLIARTLVLNLTLMLTYRYANAYGKAQAGTHALLLNLWLFSAFFLDAFATAANALSGKYLGAKNRAALHETRAKNLKLGIGVSFVLAAALLIFDEEIIGLFIKDDAVKDYYPNILPLFALCLPVNALAFVMDGIYKGLGEAKYLRNLLIISSCIGFLPALLILDYFSPTLQSVWWAMVAWMFLRGFLPYFHFHKYLKSFPA